MQIASDPAGIPPGDHALVAGSLPWAGDGPIIELYHTIIYIEFVSFLKIVIGSWINY